MGLRISAIVCAHNPRPGVLGEVLAALRGQTLAADAWEAILVDNASDRPLAADFAEQMPPNGRILREERLGLTHARIAGAGAASAPLLVFVDDDNILAPDFLEQACAIMDAEPAVACLGGALEPRYESEPPRWFRRAEWMLAVHRRRPAEERTAWHPRGRRRMFFWLPPGAGLVVRSEAFADYAHRAQGAAWRAALDRAGASLASCGDVDLVLECLARGAAAAYSPRLSLVHAIAPGRTEFAYLERLAYWIGRSGWPVFHHHRVHRHGLRPIPKALLPAAKAIAYLRGRAWRGPVARLRWRQKCGGYDACAHDLPRLAESAVA